MQNCDQNWDGIEVLTGPAVEPFTAADFKLHARIDFDTEDTLIDGYIKSAREFFEGQTGVCLINQTIAQYHEQWPDEEFFRLRRWPVSAVGSVEWTATDNVTVTTLAANTDYITNLKRKPARVLLPYEGTWPDGTLSPAHPIKITYTAGFGVAAGSIPGDILQCLRMITAYFYENREATVIAQTTSALLEMPIGVRDTIKRRKLEFHG